MEGELIPVKRYTIFKICLSFNEVPTLKATSQCPGIQTLIKAHPRVPIPPAHGPITDTGLSS